MVPPFPLKHNAETDRKLVEVFDERGAERLLKERPNHPEEALVRKCPAVSVLR
jgi:hypothetical protein